MKRMLALLLTAMLILTLLPGCGKKNPGGDAPEVPENPTEQGGETPDVTPEPEPYVDPYEAVRTYWSEDQLTQSWGPDQIVEHLFFHPVIAYPQWAFHDCGASQSERYGLDDWMVTADEYAKILQSVYEKGYISSPSRMFGARSRTRAARTWCATHSSCPRAKSRSSSALTM